jgi:hypothetical protein
MMTEPELFAKDLRVLIDGCIQQVRRYRDDDRPEYKGKRESALAYTKLQEAKMWMGKVLEELGSELPEEFRDRSPQQPQ